MFGLDTNKTKRDRKLSYSAHGAITLPSPGENMVALLNPVFTTVLAMTVEPPTKAMHGCRLTIASRNGTNTVTFRNGANTLYGTRYDAFTFPDYPAAIECVAKDCLWHVEFRHALTDTVDPPCAWCGGLPPRCCHSEKW